MTLEDRLIDAVRDVPDFPKPSIMFKDITPVLADPQLSRDVSAAFHDFWEDKGVEGVIGIESRGFIYGMQLAQQLNVPFIPVRKAGKLPFDTISHSYDLEYGSATMEIHTDALMGGQNVLIHDDLLATGGTSLAATELVRKLGGKVAGYSFLVELGFLEGRKHLEPYHKTIQSLVTF